MNPTEPLPLLAQALELMAQAVRAMPSGPAVHVAVAAPSGLLLSEWLVTFEQILAQRPYDQQTRKNRRANLAHVKRLWGAKPLRGLKPFEIAACVKALPTHTACRVLAEVRDCYAEAIANGEAETNPALHVKPPRHHGLRARLTFSVWKQMRTLAGAMPQRWVESMLLLAIVIGQRRADLARVRFDDIVTDGDGRRYLRIEQQKKAGKRIGARVEIPLALRMDAICMTVGEVVEHCRNSAAPGPTLLRKAGGGSIEESSLSARFHECIVAVLGDSAHAQYAWPSLHEVRSLSARTYMAQGLEPKTIQTLLGHKHAEMTAVYIDDRGLSAEQWKRVALPTSAAIAEAAG